jgi:hypothetical protein
MCGRGPAVPQHERTVEQHRQKDRQREDRSGRLRRNNRAALERIERSISSARHTGRFGAREVSHDPSPNHAVATPSDTYATPARANSRALPTTRALHNCAMISSTSQ